jgi:glycosyltransferase involved in cell wall biosynthesis
MRVCVVVPVLDTFKGGNHLPLLAALPDVHFTIVTNRVKKDAGDALPSNVSVEVIPGRLGPYYYGIADLRFAALTLKKFPPEHAFWKQFHVIHLNQVLGVGFSALQKSTVPVLYAVHHPVTADREIAIAASHGWERLRWRCRYFLPIVAQRRLCRNIANVMTVSSTVRDRITEDYHCSGDRVHVVPNGVDENVFMPSDRIPTFDVIALGSFLHPRKGFPYLLDTYKRLAAAGLKIADVGRRSQLQQDALRSIPQVKSFGTVDHHTLLELMSSSSVLISTALYEGFGLSLIEALASGHPAFAFKGGAVAEVLDPIDPTLVVPLRDTEQLAKNVITFLKCSSEERRRRGALYRARTIERYSMSIAASKLRALYTQLSSLPVS